MDKSLDELKDDIRKTLQEVQEMLVELNSYLDKLRNETRAELRGLGVPAEVVELIAPRPTLLAGRQPRRDGDIYGSVLPPTETDPAVHDHDPPGTVRPTRQR